MELKPNMYVRTKDGIIAKCTEIRVSRYMFDRIILENGYYNDWEFIDIPEEKSLIKKASHNIIDLIEVGDYVNGSRVMKTNCKLEYIDDDSDTGVNEVYDGLELENGWIYFEHEINSIVTKEQFESMSYKVEVEE